MKDLHIKERVAFYTLGCRLNQAETAVIRNSFQRAGYSVVGHHQPADIMVINTCTVTENGDADTRHLINRLVKDNPSTQIALIGCQAQIYREKLSRLANVRWIIGNERKMDLVSVLHDLPSQPGTSQILVPPISRKPFTIGEAGIDANRARANLKIQDGCDFFCSFCEIPYARGRSRSREFDDILKEAEILARAGHQELVLTGINLGCYHEDGKDIVDVLSALEQIPQVQRLRISSIEPTTIPEKLLKMMAGRSKICRHLHIPLQSAHNEILKKMNRCYSFQEFDAFIKKALEIVPGICLGSDIMVGFPGETEEHFTFSCDLLEKLPVHYFHVFSYSQRLNAKSRCLTGQVPPAQIRQRSEQLRKMGQNKRGRFMGSLVGTRQKVLFEQKKKDLWTGLTDHYVRVGVQSDVNVTNRLLDVRILEATGSLLFAALEKDPQTCFCSIS